MFAHILICYCSLAMVFSAPVNNNTSTTEPTSTSNASNVDQRNSTAKKININYEYYGGGFEGDMIFPKGFNPSSPIRAKGVAIYGPNRWPNRIIPYDMSAIPSTEHRNIVLRAMQTLMYAVGTPIEGKSSRKTCVYFRPRLSQDKSYVKIVYGTGCSATVGYWADYVSTMKLQSSGCFYSGTIQHELMHVLGFFHEQSRPDRDAYITVNYGNIQPSSASNFDRLKWGTTALNQNIPYDYQSIMHYGAYAFSTNGRPTITPRRSNISIGQRDKLSAGDIAEIRSFYSCS